MILYHRIIYYRSSRYVPTIIGIPLLPLKNPNKIDFMNIYCTIFRDIKRNNKLANRREYMHVLIFYSVVPAQIRSLVGEAEKGRWLGGMVAVGAGMYLIFKQDTNN